MSIQNINQKMENLIKNIAPYGLGALIVIGLIWWQTNTGYKKPVQQVMQSYGDYRQRCMDGMDGANTTEIARRFTRLYRLMSEINIGGCPQDFKDAFQRHYAATGALQKALQECQKDALDGLSKLGKKMLSGDFDWSTNRDINDVQRSAHSYDDTLKELRRVAAKYTDER